MIDLLNFKTFLTGEGVTVLYPKEGALDEMGEPVITWESENVENVLFAPSSASDLEVKRPDGTRESVIFHFPKTYKRNLRGCKIIYKGETFRVKGEPYPYMEENTPGAWNYAVSAEVVNG